MHRLIDLFKPVETEQITYVDGAKVAAEKLQIQFDERAALQQKLAAAMEDWRKRIEKSKEENPLPKENYRIVKVTKTQNLIPEVYWVVESAYHYYHTPHDIYRDGYCKAIDPEIWYNDPAGVIVAWSTVGGVDKRFSTFEEAKNWLRAYLAPETDEAYFSKDSFKRLD